MKNIGTGKVLQSNSTDNIFIFFATKFNNNYYSMSLSGGDSVLGMPDGTYMYATDLQIILINLYHQAKFN